MHGVIGKPTFRAGSCGPEELALVDRHRPFFLCNCLKAVNESLGSYMGRIFGFKVPMLSEVAHKIVQEAVQCKGM